MNLLHELDPAIARWRYLSSNVVTMEPRDVFAVGSAELETLLVVVEGAVHVTGSGIDAHIARRHLWSEVSSVVYLPPNAPVSVEAITACEISTGSAPATGRFDPKVIDPEEMLSELRGGATATRQVVTTLGPDHGAERLLSYEVWVPRGHWTGWPPHRHDGEEGSPYLEETYYYRFQTPTGFGFHRNFDLSDGFEDVTALRDHTLVPVPRGYHLCAAGPGSNAWGLNFLAGSVEDRPRPPHFADSDTWILDDWSAGEMKLPAVRTPEQPGGPQ